jgi:hypothetical protein
MLEILPINQVHENQSTVLNGEFVKPYIAYH